MPAYLPAEQRVEVIRQYAREYGIRVFVETGTSEGATVAALLDEFDVINTVELDPSLHERARERFKPWEHVNCFYGDSGEWLQSMIQFFVRPVIFWLDGHYCGGARGAIDTPIREELESAIKAPEGSVILIDDARLFGGMPEHTEEFADYPDVSWVREMAETHGMAFLLMQDIMRLTPT